MKIELLPIDVNRIENIKRFLGSDASAEMIVTGALIKWEKQLLDEKEGKQNES